MTAYSEETVEVSFGQGLYSSDLPSAIPDGFCAQADNVVATGTSIENRFGFTKTSLLYQPTVDYRDTFPPSPGAVQIGPTTYENMPVMVWGDRLKDSESTWRVLFLREGNPFTDPDNLGSFGSGEGGAIGQGSGVGTQSTLKGFMQSSVASKFIGAVQYLDHFYLFLKNDILRITDFNWSAGEISNVVLADRPSPITASPVHFFDRLWCASDNKIHFTDAPTAPGTYPETWNPTVNFFALNGKHGPAFIYKIIPFNTRLLIFTSNGLFSLSVIGAPTSWYLRSIDEAAHCNSYECAFEHNGLVYYITDGGVYVTDGASSVMVSGAISNYFLAGNFDAEANNQTKRSNLYRVNYLDGGIVASIANFVITNDGNTTEPQYNVENCLQFYSRLDNFAWSEWNFSTPKDGSQHRIGAIISVVDSIESYLNKEPLSFILAQHTRSTETTRRQIVQEMFVYDGLQDTWTLADAESGFLTTKSIGCNIKSNFNIGNHLLDLKSIKYAYLELFFNKSKYYNNEEDFIWDYQWNTDFKTILHETDLIKNQAKPDFLSKEFHIVRLEADFQFRAVQFQINVDTHNVATFKIKSLHMQSHESRDMPQFAG